VALKGIGINSTVWAWGYNSKGRLGDGTTTDRRSPVPVVGLTDVRSASAGAFHSLGVRMDGSVRAWGWNGTGALGTGGTADSWAPTPVSVSGAAVGSAGGIHSVVS
jgi:alpha-tubulin suppressor-like RCC1 family protein